MSDRIIYRFLCLLLLSSICFPVFSQQTDKPMAGEGIHAFLRRHKREGDDYYKEFIKLNDNKLGKDKSLLKGVDYVLPPLKPHTGKPENEPKPPTAAKPANATKKKMLHEPLFGKNYEYFEQVDNELAGASFYLSSGHGGPDPGAIAKVNGHQLHEDEYNYDIILRLARNLMQHGARVSIIIQDKNDGIRDDQYLKNSHTETCMGEPIPRNQKERLRQRTDKINALSRKHREQYKRAVFIHLDSRGQKEQLDVFFYYQNGVAASRRLTETMRSTFRAKYEQHQPGRGFSGTVSTRPLAVMSRTNVVSIFAELANMQNPNDQKRYVQADNRQALANWMTAGFIKDYKNSK